MNEESTYISYDNIDFEFIYKTAEPAQSNSKGKLSLVVISDLSMAIEGKCGRNFIYSLSKSDYDNDIFRSPINFVF